MKKIALIVVGIIILLVGGFFALNNYIYNEKQAYAAPDFKDAEYIIGGERVRLVNGESGGTKYFGNEVRHDFNKDGREDVAFILTQNNGGSGTFYYVVAAINTERGYVGSEALLLGDRIAPQTTEIGGNDLLIVNYADRAPGEPMTAAPSVGKSIWLRLDVEAMQFGEVVQNFEGEADPNRMTLNMKNWIWVSTTYADGGEVKPKQSLAFTLDFLDNNEFTATTDCNRIGGKYTVNDGTIAFSDIFMTKMACQDSQENEFANMLTSAATYEFTSRGQLVLSLKAGSGTVTFR
jgi:heat shock protein HslJ